MISMRPSMVFDCAYYSVSFIWTSQADEFTLLKGALSRHYGVFTWRHGGHVEGVNKETAPILEKWNILLGIYKLYFYANPSFCFIMQIWLLVTWANTLS